MLHQPAPRLRCVGVAGAATGLGAAAIHLLTGQLDGTLATVDEAVVQVCVVALLVCVAWVWAGACAVVVQVWRRSDQAGSGPVVAAPAVRRVVLWACGAALAGAVAAPAYAGDGSLGGLPMPERALGPAHPYLPPAATTEAGPGTVTVRPGDSLWLITARGLPAGASAATITTGWQRLYRANRAVIGPDPGLIHPGQVLRRPVVHAASPTD